MLKLLQKYAPFISIALLLLLLVTLIFQQDSAQITSSIMLIFGLGMAVLFTIQSNWETKKNANLTIIAFTRNTFLDLLGLALTMGAAMWLGRLAGSYVGLTWGIWAGIIAGIAVGFGAAYLVRKLWGQVGNRLRAAA